MKRRPFIQIMLTLLLAGPSQEGRELFVNSQIPHYLQDRFYPARDESKSSPNRSEKIFYSSFSDGAATLFSAGSHRMTPLQAAQLIVGDTSLLPLKEWEGLNGELGVYHSHAHGHSYLFILIPSEEKHALQPYPPTDRDKVSILPNVLPPSPAHRNASPDHAPSAFAFRPIYGLSGFAMPSSALLMHSCPRKDGLKGFFWPRQHYHDEATQH